MMKSFKHLFSNHPSERDGERLPEEREMPCPLSASSTSPSENKKNSTIKSVKKGGNPTMKLVEEYHDSGGFRFSLFSARLAKAGWCTWTELLTAESAF